MKLLNLNHIKKEVESIIEDYLESKTVIVNGMEASFQELLDECDNDFVSSEVSDEIVNMVYDKFLLQLVYDYKGGFFNETCKWCNKSKGGYWESVNGNDVIFEDELKGKHIIVPR